MIANWVPFPNVVPVLDGTYLVSTAADFHIANFEYGEWRDVNEGIDITFDVRYFTALPDLPEGLL